MSNDGINFNIGNMSGGIATGSGSQAVGAGGSVVNGMDSELGALLAAIRVKLDTLPETGRVTVELLVAEVEREAAAPKPDQSRIQSLLQSVRPICEGAIGNLIAAYMGAG